jgi:FkbM family methyltransferase
VKNFAARLGSGVPGGAFVDRTITRVYRTFGVSTVKVFEIDGREFRYDTADARRNRVLAEASGDGSLADSLTALLGPGDSYIDAGANGGGYVLFAAGLVGPSGRLLAIEPQTHLADNIRRSLEANRIPGTVHCVALSDREGQADLYVPRGKSGSASLNHSEGEQRRVKMVTLDSLVTEDLPGRTVMKIDVEGNEFALLRGAEATLARVRPTLVMEHNPTLVPAAAAAEMYGWLEERGYAFAETTAPGEKRSAAQLEMQEQRDILVLPS